MYFVYLQSDPDSYKEKLASWKIANKAYQDAMRERAQIIRDNQEIQKEWDAYNKYLKNQYTLDMKAYYQSYDEWKRIEDQWLLYEQHKNRVSKEQELLKKVADAQRELDEFYHRCLVDLEWEDLQVQWMD